MTDRGRAAPDGGLDRKGFTDMKQGNTFVTAILAAAVLLAACGIGLLIRPVRLGRLDPPSEPVAESAVMALPEAPAANQPKAEELAEVGGLTEEQSPQRHDAPRAQLRSQRREPGRVPHLSPEELDEISRKWSQMTEEERQAFRSALSRTRSANRPERTVPADANVPATNEPNATDGNAEQHAK